MSCMLQPPVPSLPPMAPASGSADHAVSGARSGYLSIAAGCRWLLDAPRRSRGRRQLPSTPRNPTLAHACSRECTCRARGLALGGWRVVLGDEAEVRAFSTRPISFPPLPRPSIMMPHGCCALSERPGRPLPSSAPPTGAQTPRRAQVSGRGSWQAWHTQSAEHARARAGLRGLRGGRRPPGDRREAPRRQRQPPDPAADTCEHGGRCQPNPLLEPPAAARGRAPRACQAWANRGTFRRDLTARGPS